MDLFGQIESAVNNSTNTVYSIPGVSRNQLESVLDGDKKVKSILPLVDKLYHENPHLGFLLVNELLLSAKVKKYSKVWAILNYFKTKSELDNYYGNEELELLRENIKESIAFLGDKNEPFWLAKCLSLLADIQFNISYNNYDSLYQEAKIANDQALELMLDNQNDIEQSYSILGEIYQVKGNICQQLARFSRDSVMSIYDVAMEYYTLNKDRSGQSQVWINKAIALSRQEFQDSIISKATSTAKFFENAIEISDWQHDRLKARMEYAIFLQNKFLLTREKDWNNRSNDQLERIIEKSESNKSGAYFQLAVNAQSYLSYMARVLSEEMKSELLDTTVYFYEETLLSCLREHDLKVYNETFDRLTIACPYFSKAQCSRLLSIANEVKSHFLKKNKLINEEITKRNEAFRIAIESQKRKGLWMIFVVVFLLGLLFASYLFYRQKLKNLNSTLEIRQEALRAQMNPHFISNSINAIESLVNQERNEEASEYLIDFSRLCRLVINHSRDASIALQEEIETLKYFLRLEKLRLGDDLEYTITIDNKLNAIDVMVPPLILQPFIENAIWHGIKNKQNPKHGELKIEVNKLSQNTIECIIEDNGVGRDKAKENQEASIIDQKSWGTTLTRERIEFLERDQDASLEIIDLFDENNKARGTKVRIVLPVKPKK